MLRSLVKLLSRIEPYRMVRQYGLGTARGYWCALASRFRESPFLFRDRWDNAYWITRDDDLLTYGARSSVSDAFGSIELVRRLVEPGWTCLDLGCNLGSVSIAMWRRVGNDGKVISIDADPNNVKRVRQNLEANGLATSSVVHAAITETQGSLPLTVFEGKNGWQTLGEPHLAPEVRRSYIEVPCMTVLDVASEFNLERIDLLKMDIEGAEVRATLGMLPWLEEKRVKHCVFEVNPIMAEGMDASVGELIQMWANAGYNLQTLLPDGQATELPPVSKIVDNRIPIDVFASAD